MANQDLRSRPRGEPPVRVMVVEDDADYQEVLILILTLEPHVVLAGVASSGEDALRQFDKAAPHVVFTDYRLPGMNGLELAERMKTRNPRTLVVIVSAVAEEIEEQAAASHVVDDLIAKPELSLARIKNLLHAAGHT